MLRTIDILAPICLQQRENLLPDVVSQVYKINYTQVYCVNQVRIVGNFSFISQQTFDLFSQSNGSWATCILQKHEEQIFFPLKLIGKGASKSNL